MYVFLKKETRQHLDIPFYFEAYPASNEYKTYVNNNYIITKMYISSELNYSDDMLSVTTKSSWSSHDAFLKFSSDSFCFDNYLILSREYNYTNNIKVEYSII